ncbi:MAG: acetyl-CoA carboxylase, biotin carboxyl carrier protein, partial [Pseudomonadota bacterium]
MANSDKNGKTKNVEAAWIRELATILNDTGLTEIEVENEDVRLRVSKAAPAGVAAAP